MAMNGGRPSLTVKRACTCSTWGTLDGVARDTVLFYFTDWAWIFYEVELKLLNRGDRIAICEIHSMRPAEGRTRKVLTEIGLWADCARVILELSPSSHWGADEARLTRFYKSLGFEPNEESDEPLRIKESMIRYPLRGRGHASR